MKKKEKIVILVLLIIAIVLVVVGIKVKTNNGKIANNDISGNKNTEDKIPSADEENIAVLEDGTRFNTSDALHRTKAIDGIGISDIQLIEKGNVSELLATATNTTSTVQGDFGVKVTFIDKEGKEIVTINGSIKELKPGEKTQFYTSGSIDFANAYDFKIEKQ